MKALVRGNLIENAEWPHKRMVDIPAFAWGLTGIQRWNGGLSAPWSVADHSMALAKAGGHRKFSQEEVIWCLIHDMAEAITGDVSANLISAGLADGLADLSQEWEWAICDALGAERKMPKCVSDLDIEIRNAELELLGSEKSVDAMKWRGTSTSNARWAVASVFMYPESRWWRYNEFLHQIDFHTGTTDFQAEMGEDDFSACLSRISKALAGEPIW